MGVCSLSCLVSGEPENDASVFCTATVTIPAKSCIVFLCRVQASCSFNTGVLEPVDTLPGGIIFPTCAVSWSEKKQIPLRLPNLSLHNVQVPKGQRVATFVDATLIDPSDE